MMKQTYNEIHKIDLLTGASRYITLNCPFTPAKVNVSCMVMEGDDGKGAYGIAPVYAAASDATNVVSVECSFISGSSRYCAIANFDNSQNPVFEFSNEGQKIFRTMTTLSIKNMITGLDMTQGNLLLIIKYES